MLTDGLLESRTVMGFLTFFGIIKIPLGIKLNIESRTGKKLTVTHQDFSFHRYFSR